MSSAAAASGTMEVAQMRYVCAIMASAALLAAGCGKQREDEIKTAWDAFAAAIAKKDGKKVWALLSTESREFFDNAAKSARDDAGDATFSKRWTDLLEMPKDKLKDVTGESLVEKLVDLQDREKPHNHFATYRDAKFRDVTRTGNEAKGTVSRGDSMGYEEIGYAWEDRLWKIKVHKTRFVWQ